MKTNWMFASIANLPAGLALTLIVGLASAASAQTYAPQAGPSGFGYGGGYRHASTYEEGVLRGYADLNRSRGEANYWHSLAAINRQDAYSKYLQNREAKTETYFRMQAINRAAREATRPVRMNTEQLAILARKQAPDRLNGQQYDRNLGRLNWPAVLTHEAFTAEREVLDAAFAARTPGDADYGSAFGSGVRQLTTSMQNRLQANMAGLNQMEYIAAKKFLTGLALEAQQPLMVESIAAAE